MAAEANSIKLADSHDNNLQWSQPLDAFLSHYQLGHESELVTGSRIATGIPGQ